jgi:hypothetical protein
MALDAVGNLYMGSGESASSCAASTTANTLWRMNADQSYSKVLDFCQYAQEQGSTQVHPRRRACGQHLEQGRSGLYVLTGVSATGVADSTLTSDNLGRAVGTLVKLSQAAIDSAVAATVRWMLLRSSCCIPSCVPATVSLRPRALVWSA